MNRAKTRGIRERRSVPFSAIAGLDQEATSAEPAVAPERFLPADHRWPGHWAAPPASWRDVPEARLVSKETYAEIERAIDALPASQRAVVTLRDVEGWSAAAMPPAGRIRLEQHLQICDGCANYLEQLRTTVRLAGRLTREAVSPVVAPLLEAFRAWSRS